MHRAQIAILDAMLHEPWAFLDLQGAGGFAFRLQKEACIAEGMGLDYVCAEATRFLHSGFSSHSNYCAANAAVDAVAEAAACQGVPFVSVQWGAWSAVG